MSEKISFHIPESHLELLNALINLTLEQRKLLLDSLKKCNPTLNRNEVITELSQLTKIKKDILFQIIEYSVSLYRGFYEIGYEKKDDFINQYREAFEIEIKDKIENFDTLKEKIIFDFIQDILDLDRSIGIIAKGDSLTLNDAKIFLQSRIITDLRPIYPFNINKENIEFAIISHNLKIQYIENNKEKEIFISLDDIDLRNLQSVIERALIKQLSLKRLCQENQINIIG